VLCRINLTSLSICRPALEFFLFGYIKPCLWVSLFSQADISCLFLLALFLLSFPVLLSMIPRTSPLHIY